MALGSLLSALPLMTGTRRVGARSLLRVPATFKPLYYLSSLRNPRKPLSFNRPHSICLPTLYQTLFIWLPMGSRVVTCARCLVPRQPPRLHPTLGAVCTWRRILLRCPLLWTQLSVQNSVTANGSTRGGVCLLSSVKLIFQISHCFRKLQQFGEDYSSDPLYGTTNDHLLRPP
jgi:hypothetical protein